MFGRFVHRKGAFLVYNWCTGFSYDFKMLFQHYYSIIMKEQLFLGVRLLYSMAMLIGDTINLRKEKLKIERHYQFWKSQLVGRWQVYCICERGPRFAHSATVKQFFEPETSGL